MNVVASGGLLRGLDPLEPDVQNSREPRIVVARNLNLSLLQK